MNAPGSQPLSGVRIIEIGHMLAGPYCGMLLADLGAEVIKIEAPPGGDIGRTIGPHKAGSHNTYFASLNRGKKSVLLDLASPAGKTALSDLVRSAQGLVTNLRPSAIKKLGLTYSALSDINPRIACLALTGYGLEGPFADRPAYDYVIQALAGVMALTGDPGGPPIKTGYSVVDNSAGIMGALALVAAIHGGRGGQVDVSLYDVMLSQMNYLASAYLNAGEKPSRQASGAHPYIVPAQIFATLDGHLALFISHDEFWRRFANEVGCEHWLSNPRFATMRGRSENRDLVIGEVAALLRMHCTQEWVDRLGRLDLVVAGVETLDQALESDLTLSRGMVVTVPTREGALRLVGSPIRVEGGHNVFGPPPRLGEHTGEFVPDRAEALLHGD
jgi:CoA:oxalate CoA-transferase